MSGPKTSARRAADLLHERAQTMERGDPVALPLTATTMYHLPGDPAPGVPGYGRPDNPTWQAVEASLSLIEDAPALLFPSGMGSIAAALFACVNAGDKVLLPSDGYYATRVLADQFLKNMGVEIDHRPTATYGDGGFDGYALVFIETPSNPGLDVCDLATVASAVRAAGGRTIADNTTLTPLGQRPLDLGIDVVVAADTKAPGGHSDILAGHVASRDEALMARVKEWRTFSGAIPGPFEAWLLHRSLETLEVRFDRMCNSAQIIAERLEAHPKVKSVRYPGLKSDPSHALAAKQQDRFGFLMSLTLADDAQAETFINTCPYLRPATSFGGVHSSAERRIRWGDDVPPGFVRLSVGIEPVEPLWDAIEQSIDQF